MTRPTRRISATDTSTLAGHDKIQMAKVIRPHKASGYIAAVKYNTDDRRAEPTGPIGREKQRHRGCSRSPGVRYHGPDLV